MAFRMTKQRIDAAMNYLEQIHRSMEEESDTERGVDEPGFIIKENVSTETFLRFIDKEPKLQFKIRLIDGRVIAYEMTKGRRSRTAFQVAQFFTDATGHLADLDQLHGGSKVDVIVGPGPNNTVIADSALTPGQRPRPPLGQACDTDGSPYPTLVIEVGLTESLQSLHELAPRYFSPRSCVRLYLAIKIFGLHRGGTRALLALLYRRPNPRPIVVRSFGTAPLAPQTLLYLRGQGVLNNAIKGFERFGAPPCNAPGIGTYQIFLPVTELYHGTGGVPAGLPANILVDLYRVQTRALN